MLVGVVWMTGAHAALGPPTDAYTQALPERSVQRISPVGRTSMLPRYEGSPLAGGGPGTSIRALPFHSKKTAPFLKTPGPVSTRTLPLGRSAAGPSATPRLNGKSGPGVQVRVFVS